jgi:peroxiredoxin
MVAISPQSPDHSLSTKENAGLGFTVLSDTGAAVAKRLGIAFEPSGEVRATQRTMGLDIALVNADPDPRLPMPTVLIVDRHHIVRFAETHADYTERTEVDEILSALTQIVGCDKHPSAGADRIPRTARRRTLGSELDGH